MSDFLVIRNLQGFASQKDNLIVGVRIFFRRRMLINYIHDMFVFLCWRMVICKEIIYGLEMLFCHEEVV